MELCGFVDLGSHIPDKQKNELSGHILVFRFQTFAGKSIQAFGNVTGEVQAKLMPECIILCEQISLQVTATWNRNMWNHFGITDSSKPWCNHPVVSEDQNPTPEERQLKFCSDWHHLIKCLRNLLIKRQKLVVSKIKHNELQVLYISHYVHFKVPQGVMKYAFFASL